MSPYTTQPPVSDILHSNSIKQRRSHSTSMAPGPAGCRLWPSRGVPSSVPSSPACHCHCLTHTVTVAVTVCHCHRYGHRPLSLSHCPCLKGKRAAGVNVGTHSELQATNHEHQVGQHVGGLLYRPRRRLPCSNDSYIAYGIHKRTVLRHNTPAPP